MERSTCLICKRKLKRAKMIQHGQHWTCASCVNERPQTIPPEGTRIKVLNLYAGVGGNRWLWPEYCHVTAVELNPKIAAEYKANFPNDALIIGDAHAFLLKNYRRFDIIWSSPPCQTHTKMNFTIEHKRYIDFKLWQEIIFLRSFFKGRFVVENVKPYYSPLIVANFELCRHLFWTNVPELRDVTLPEFPAAYQGRHKGLMIMPKDAICAWLGITAGQKNIYLTSKSNTQIYRNCVHPQLGASIMDDILKSMTGGINCR